MKKDMSWVGLLVWVYLSLVATFLPALTQASGSCAALFAARPGFSWGLLTSTGSARLHTYIEGKAEATNGRFSLASTGDVLFKGPHDLDRQEGTRSPLEVGDEVLIRDEGDMHRVGTVKRIFYSHGVPGEKLPEITLLLKERGHGEPDFLVTLNENVQTLITWKSGKPAAGARLRIEDQRAPPYTWREVEGILAHHDTNVAYPSVSVRVVHPLTRESVETVWWSQGGMNSRGRGDLLVSTGEIAVPQIIEGRLDHTQTRPVRIGDRVAFVGVEGTFVVRLIEFNYDGRRPSLNLRLEKENEKPGDLWWIATGKKISVQDERLGWLERPEYPSVSLAAAGGPIRRGDLVSLVSGNSDQHIVTGLVLKGGTWFVETHWIDRTGNFEFREIPLGDIDTLTPREEGPSISLDFGRLN